MMNNHITFATPGAPIDHSSKTSSLESIEKSIQILKQSKDFWANRVPIEKKITLLDSIRQAICHHANQWINEDLQARQRDLTSYDAVTSIVAGPAMVLRLIRCYIQTLTKIKNNEKLTKQTFKRTTSSQWGLRVFPEHWHDKVLFNRFTVDVLFQKGAELETILATLAQVYQQPNIQQPELGLVLGAGNFSGLTISDILYKLINERSVVLVKIHPLTEYLGEIIEKIFAEFIVEGFVKVVYGGVEVGKLLCQHQDIDTIHVTGSSKTFETIVFGSGEKGRENLRENQPILRKRVTGELGNVSPLIIIPGEWSTSELEYVAKNIVSSFVFNSGFACYATRVIVTSAHWPLRDQLIEKVKDILQQIPPQACYYPGSVEQLKQALEIYPHAFLSGTFSQGCSPWIFVTDVDSRQGNEFCFKNEIFGSFMAETAIPAPSIESFLEKTVDFCNATLWGTLSATIIVHPKTQNQLEKSGSFQRAINNLKYGTVGINIPSQYNYYLCNGTWGGYPGATLQNIQSGVGLVHNAKLLPLTEKTIIQAPFTIFPNLFFATYRKLVNAGWGLFEFEKQASLRSLLRCFKQIIQK